MEVTQWTPCKGTLDQQCHSWWQSSFLFFQKSAHLQGRRASRANSVPPPHSDGAPVTLVWHALNAALALLSGTGTCFFLRPYLLFSWADSKTFELEIRNRDVQHQNRYLFLPGDNVCWLLSVWLWRTFAEFIRGDRSWFPCPVPCQPSCMILWKKQKQNPTRVKKKMKGITNTFYFCSRLGRNLQFSDNNESCW